MMDESPRTSLSRLAALPPVPAGAWAVAVSGGADSVALLALLRGRAELGLHVVHLDHETRAGESAKDAAFVSNLARKWNLPITLATRSQLESRATDLPKNISARYRALRHQLFRETIQAHKLQGVLLAHHADDQAETVMQRLVRGSGISGLVGMSRRCHVGGVLLVRPLLGIRREIVRAFLSREKIEWREDSSNQESKYQRNRVRRLLAGNEALTQSLLGLSAACATLKTWVRGAAPVSCNPLEVRKIQSLPAILARDLVSRWLAERGVPRSTIDPQVIERLVTMATDAASPARADFPGRVHVRRRRGLISTDVG